MEFPSSPSQLNKVVKKKFVELIRLATSYFHRQIVGRLRPNIQYLFYRYKYAKAAPIPWKTIIINPDQVKYKLVPNFRTRIGKHLGTFIKSGDWDVKIASNDSIDKLQNITQYDIQSQGGILKLKNHFFFKSVENHFSHGVPWEETELYQVRESNYNKKVAKKECKHLTKLYKKIKSEGYKTQKEIHTDFNTYPRPEYDEIRINIGRNGKLIFDDGRHRFAIVRALGIKKIPVRVFVRHKFWQDKRQKILKANKSNVMDKRTPPYFKHPDVEYLINNH